MDTNEHFLASVYVKCRIVVKIWVKSLHSLEEVLREFNTLLIQSMGSNKDKRQDLHMSYVDIL